jgi:hypothetical protein
MPPNSTLFRADEPITRDALLSRIGDAVSAANAKKLRSYVKRALDGIGVSDGSDRGLE